MSRPAEEPRILLEAAREWAVAAGEITLGYFGEVVAAQSKGDGTPVTRADREAETFLRNAIRERFPTHGILGEEFGEHIGEGSVRWILDPIDGTRSFMRGVPLYTVLIGIEVEGRPEVGVIHMPALRETVAAAHGQGCWWWRPGAASPVRARVSAVRELGEALVLTTDALRVERSELAPGWRRVREEADFSRGWGDAYGHALVATGRAEVMLDPELSPWDAAPLLPVVVEAGGAFSDLSGKATIHGGSGVSTNGRLHAEVLRALGEAAPASDDGDGPGDQRGPVA